MFNIGSGKYLFKSGTSCKDLHIIVSGEVDIFITNQKKQENYLDTLYQGCVISTYSVLTEDDYTISAQAKTDWVVLRLSNQVIEKMRDRYKELDYIISEYEQYIEEEGLPYCDYKIFRTGINQMTPIKKFQLGIRRIMRIVVCLTA